VRSVSWAQLGQYDFISVGRTSGNRVLLDQALAGLPNRPQAIYEAQHVTTTLGLVEAGLGVAAVPSMAMPGRTTRCWSACRWSIRLSPARLG
jgi:DNA-binding transcriptional LysR family regulator